MSETKSSSANHYVDNVEFYQEMVEFIEKNQDFPKDHRPDIPNSIGKKIMDICTHLSYKPSFINYPFRDMMVSDAIENCLIYIRNFDHIKYKNPFAYFTQIAYFAFIRRIRKERNVMRLKAKYVQNLAVIDDVFAESIVSSQDHDDGGQFHQDIASTLQKYFEYDLGAEEEQKKAEEKRKAKKAANSNDLDSIFEEKE